MVNIEWLDILLDFISGLLTSWSFVFFVIVLLFHAQIGVSFIKIIDLLSRMKSAKFGDKSFIFSEQLAKIGNDELKIHKENTPKIGLDWDFTKQDEFEKLALLRPDFAILDSWRPIEKRLLRIGEKEFKSDSKEVLSVQKILSHMVKNQMISQSDFFYIKEIRILRNKVVHNSYGYLTSMDASLYRGNCIEAMQILESI